MSVSAPPAAAPPAGKGAAPDKGSLHDLAVDTAADLRQLAQGLAHAGAAPPAVQGLEQMAQKIDEVVKILVNAPEVEHAAKTGEPPAPPAGPEGPPPPSGLAPGAPGGPPPGGAFGPATAALHSAMQAHAAGP